MLSDRSLSPRARGAALTLRTLLAATLVLGVSACGDDPAPPQTYTLTIAGTGTGSGRVVSTPAGIDCAITNGAAAATGCTATFQAGVPVGLVASPAAATLEFVGWGAPCASEPACTLTVGANTTISAGFRPRVQTLTLSLQAPAGRADGAMLLTLSGPSILAGRPGAGLELAEAPGAAAGGAASRRRVLLRGALASGAVLEVDVPGSATASQYAASVEQVAARASDGYA